MDLSKKSREELTALCKERGIKGYSGKKKDELIGLLTPALENVITHVDSPAVVPVEAKTGPLTGPLTGPRTGPLRMIDLFAGTGAFSLAFQGTGRAQCVFANDMVPASRDAYNLNHTHALTLENLHDVKTETIPAHDLLTGGFPCQPFSIAGKQEGFEDKRSNVFWKILEILDRWQPACVVLENVKNLVAHDEGRTFEIITTNLKNRGYHVVTKVLNTAKITGVPQHRERIYIVGIRSKEVFDKFTLDFPAIEKRPVSDFFETAVPAKYYYGETSSTWPLVSANVVKRNTIYQYRRVYVRENKSQECPTLTANMGGGGHNVPIILDDRGIRKLTPRECFRFQGFPDTYKLPPLSDSHLYKLAGNAVSVPVVRLIADRLTRLLNDSS